MATKVDPKVAKIVDGRNKDLDDEDDLIAELEAEEDNAAFTALREKRLEQLHEEVNRAKLFKESKHGTYIEIKDEKELLDITTSTKFSIVHFMKPDFNRCRIMDGKLEPLAEKHYEARFVSMNVDNAPFLVVKLGIQVLPCVLAFVDGVSVDRIVGFEGIGKRPDSFTAAELEARLLACGVLARAKVDGKENRQRTVKQLESEDGDVYDEDEWD